MNKVDLKLLLTNLKSDINKYGDKVIQDVIKKGVNDSFTPIVSKGEYTNFELVQYTKEYARLSAENAYKNGLSWLGLDDCIETLKKTYKIPQEYSLLLKKQDYSSDFTNQQMATPISNSASYGVNNK